MRARRPIVAVAALACLLIVVLFLGYTVIQRRTPDVQRTPVAKKPRLASQPTSAAVDYVGYWCDSANAPRRVMSRERIDELEVVEFDGNHLLFTVMHTGSAPAYRITSSEDTVTALVVDGMARAEFHDDRGGTNRATIQLLGDRLLVRIDPLEASDNGSLRMDVMMLKDPYHGTREVDEDVSPVPTSIVRPGYYTPPAGSPERGALMDAARKTFPPSEQTKFVVYELYVQDDWAVGTLDPVGYESDPPHENVYVWKRVKGKWTCLQGCGDVGELSLDDIRTSIGELGVPADLVAAVQFK